ncbi:ABC transporter B family member 9 isoform X1 [Ricinus communis]|nr:ABC transporter B family member 9 isoform X1 [Ricinus communis]|eukprot:XP_015582280.1 ABC transporter B family member 9 [Ricinus communis]
MKGNGEASVGEKRRDKKVAFYKLFTFADSLDWVLIVVGTVCATAHGLSDSLMILIFSKIINSFGTAQKSDIIRQVSEIAVTMVYLAVGTGIASFLQASCWLTTGERQSVRIRGLYLKTILRQDIAFFDTELRTGEVIERLSSNSIHIRIAIAEKAGKLIQLVSAFIGGFTVAFVRGWHLALVLAFCVPVLAINFQILSIVMSKLVIRQQLARVEAGNVVEQTIGAIRMVASFTGEKHAIAKYNEKLRIAYKASMLQGLAMGFFIGVLFFVLFVTYGLASWYGSILIIHKGYNGGQVICVIMAITGAAMALGQVSSFLRSFTTGQVAAYRMFKIIERKSKIDSYSSRGMVLEDINGEIELKDVYFRYPSRPDVEIFSGLSLHLPSSRTVALVGQSGSGKSTVISLIERFYDPDSGEILVDGFSLNKLNISWLREKIGLVSQEPVLFATSIKENIAYGKENATDEEIRFAVALANAAEFIDKMPQGLGTIVGQRGTQLSGGQKQRIAIARAIVKNPKILLLDEPTSALDAKSEHIIQDALVKVMSNRTTLIVAHRLTTIRNADEILVLHRGKVVEKGTHEELIQNMEGAYSQLVRLQEVKEGTHSHAKDEATSETTLNEDKLLSSSGTPDIPETSVPRPDNLHEGLSSNKISEKPKKGSLKRLAYLNKPELPVLLLGTIGAMLYGVVFPIFGLLTSKSIVLFYEPPRKMQNDSKIWAAFFLGLGFITLVGIITENFFFGIAGGRLIERISSRSFQRVVHQEISWFDDPTNSSGAVSARLSINATTIETVIGEALPLVIKASTTMITALLIAFTANWILAFVVVAVSPLLFLQGYANAKFMKGFSRDAKVMYEQASQVAHEAIGNIRTVASFCAEEKVTNLYEKKCEAPKKQGVQDGVLKGSGFGFSNFILHSTHAFCLYIGSILVHHGKASFEDVFRVFFALTVAINTVSGTNDLALNTTRAMEAIASIFNIFDRKPKIDSSSDEGITPVHVDGNIDLHHVSFKYPTRPDVQILKDLSLKIPAEKVVAIVGESGSGKSTIISLIQRFYDPDSGCMYFDGLDIKSLKLNWLRQQMGLVSQEPVVFHESIRSNIAYGKQGDVNEEEIIEAARAANAHEFISSLPEGYSTSVGEQGVQLSGGQKQRIAIARAILRKPKVLLLDEATSALDAESEHAVQDALQKVMINRTTVVVSHRLSSIKNADIIVVVKNGVIVEKGSHDALMKIPNGSYASLVTLYHNKD